MNDKELFYLLLKYSNIVISRYEKLSSCDNSNVSKMGNNISDEVLLNVTKKINIYSWDELVHGITQDPNIFLELYLYAPEHMESLFDLPFDKRRKVVSVIEQNSKLKEVVNPYFLRKLWQGGEIKEVYLEDILLDRSKWWWAEQEYCDKKGFEGLKNLPYTYDFSVELIKENLVSWNKQSFEYFNGMNRTSDTNYHYYIRITAWDLLSKQESILLTYGLCKFLISLDVVIGGAYILEDDRNLCGDNQNHSINALKLFRLHDVMDNSEFIKITQDKEIIEYLFACANEPIDMKYYYLKDHCIVGHFIDKLIIDFFKDFSFEKFKAIATEMHISKMPNYPIVESHPRL